MPTRCSKWFRSRCHRSSANAHHAARKLSDSVIPTHGATDAPAAICQFAKVRQPARIARTAIPTARFRRPVAFTRRSTPPVVAGLACQPAGRLGDSVAHISVINLLHRALNESLEPRRVRRIHVQGAAAPSKLASTEGKEETL